MSKLRVLLLIGGHPTHNQPVHYAELASLLACEAGADVRMTDDLGVLNRSELDAYSVIVNYTSWMEPSAEQAVALVEAVANGRGYLGLHAATATFWNSPRYLEMLGAKFERHDPFKHFQVHIEPDRHPITEGVDDFEIDDELYELSGDLSRVQVLAAAEGHPLLYVKQHGRGRVHYNALGHDGRALSQPEYRQLVRQGLQWAAG